MNEQHTASPYENPERTAPPTREEMTKFYKEQLPLLELRAKCARLQRDIVVADAERLQALSVIASFQLPSDASNNQSDNQPAGETSPA